MLVRIFSVDDTETRYLEDDSDPTRAQGLTPIRTPRSVEGTKLIWEGDLECPPQVDDNIALRDKDVVVIEKVLYLPSSEDPAFVALFVQEEDHD